MKKFTSTYVFGLIGALSWALTILLRETYINNLPVFNFILGIMPNISAAWVFIYIGELIITKIYKAAIFKYYIVTSAFVFLLALASEIIHDLYLSSSFDIYDIIGTIAAISSYLAYLYFLDIKKHSKFNQ